MSTLVAMVLLTAVHAGQLSTFRIPFLANAPVVDGEIDPQNWPDNEWSMAVWLAGFSAIDSGEPAETLDSVAVGYDAAQLYVVVTIHGIDNDAILCKATRHDTGAWSDESVELHVGVGQHPEKTYQFAVNADNVVYDAVNEPHRHDKTWNGSWRHATTRQADAWTAEMAIPWATLGLAEPVTGGALRINVGHNHRRAGTTGVVPTSWGRLHDPSGKSWTFSSIERMPLARLAGTAPVAGVVLSAEEGSDLPAYRIRTTNPTPDAHAFRYCVLKEFWNNVPAPPGRWHTLRLPLYPDENGIGFQEIHIRDESGETAFRHVVPFRARVGASIRLKRHFPVNYVELEVGAALTAGLKARLTLADSNGNELQAVTRTLEAGRPKPIRVDIAALPFDVPHVLRFELLNAGGEVTATRRFEVVRPPVPAWLGTEAGLSGQPLPPYTPIVVQGDTMSCLLKEYAFGGRALPASIKSQSHELLARPVTMVLVTDGVPHDLAATPIRVTRSEPNRVEWTSSPIGLPGLGVTVSGWMEEDGFMWCTVALRPGGPVVVEDLQLCVPVRRAFATFYNAGLPWPEHVTDDVDSLSDDGRVFDRYFATVSLLNYERGLCVVADNIAPWRPRDRRRCQDILVRDNAAVLRYRIIEKPTPIRADTAFEFGFMAMPAKPVDRRQRDRRMVHSVVYSDAVRPFSADGASRVEYPVEGNLDPARGTLELYVFADFDATYRYPDERERWHLWQRLFWIGDKSLEGDCAMLMWSAATGGWHFQRLRDGKAESVASMASALPWPAPAWHHVAVTWGERVSVYTDGVQVAEAEAGTLFPETVRPDEARLVLGKRSPAYRAEWRVSGLRISGRRLELEDMALDGCFRRTPDTLLLQDLSAAEEGARPPAPQKGEPGAPVDGARVVRAHGRSTLTFGTVPDVSRVEHFAGLGVKILGYHSHWSHDYGSPRTPYRKPLEVFCEACRRQGIRPVFYFGYGLGGEMPESKLYEDYWAVQPRHVWAGGGPQSFVAASNAVPHFTDFILDGVEKLYRSFPLGGLYYDHVQTPPLDSNPHNGAGWVDEDGTLRPRYRVLPARRYIKRLWAITKSAAPSNFIDCHGSGYVNPVRAAWVDRMWIGELFRPGQRTFDFDFYSVECVGNPYGMASDFLVMHKGLPFTWEQSLTYTLPHDNEPRAIAWKYDQIAVLQRLWEVKDAFDTDNAEWWPFWKNAEYVEVTSDGPLCVASFHLHRGKRSLVVVSNVAGQGTASARLALHLDKMGLAGAVVDAYTKERLPLEGNTAQVTLSAHGMRLLWVE